MDKGNGGSAASQMAAQAPALTKKDFVSNQDVRWCPGCGDYAILSTAQNVLPKLGIPREQFVMISGIGCSSRFPYYVNTYGFHSIHGRAPTFATGLKLARPELSIWIVTGDGDGLSIGGNHLVHIMRRNVDCTILLFNNRIYGLTKGQCSPTSEFNKKTKSTPLGSIDYPINPISLALASEASFIARTLDTDPKHMAKIFQMAAEHKGTSFVEIFQNCIIFNDGAFEAVSDKTTRPDNAIYLEHGRPLVYGKDGHAAIRLNGWKPETITFDGPTPPEGVPVHDETSEDPSWAYLLSRLDHQEGFPAPMGVFRRVRRDTYEDLMTRQIDESRQKQGPGDLQALLTGEDTWTVS